MKKIWSILLFSIINCCIDPASIDVPEFKYQLVVDGFITTDPGPYTVKLYRSRPLGAAVDLDRLIAEKYAAIILKDDEGNSELLTQTLDGVYQTKVDGMVGKIGQSYHIEITLLNGKKYESNPEIIRPVGEVTSVRYEFTNGNGVLPKEGDGFKIFADGTGVLNQEDLVRLRMAATYKITTFPERRLMSAFSNGTIIKVPNPYPCSGYINSNDRLVKVKECECCTCWVTINEEVPIIANEKYTSNELFRDEELGFMPIFIDLPTPIQPFYDSVYVQVQEMSLTPETYLFWKLVRSQKLGLSNLFQPPSAQLKGNIKSINTDDEALGIFWAAGFNSKSIYIDKKNIPYIIPAQFEIIAPCTFLPNSSNQKPSFWQ
jgi:hypothetical protein